MTKILLVEDDHQIATYLSELLQAEGFDTQIAGSKKEAGDCLLAKAFDLVLLDVSLPDGNGFSICAEIKREYELPVIFLTASGDEYSVGQYIVDGQMNYLDRIYFVEDTQYEIYLKQLGLNPEEYLRAENPKLLILNAVKGAADFDDGRRRFYEGAMFQDSSELSEISIIGEKKIGDAWYAYPDPEDPSMMIYLVGDGKTAQSDDDFKKFKVPVEESKRKLQFEIGETVEAEDYPYWAWAGNWGLVLPLSAYQEDLFITPNIQDYAYVKTVDSERALELMVELRNEYDEVFDIGMPPQTDQYEANMIRIVNVCLLCFLVLIILISLANIANTITTSVRLRTREYALIKAAGCGKYTFLRMIFAENLSYTLRGFVIGGLMGVLANYKSYSYLKDMIYTNEIIPIGLYAVGAAAFVLVMIFSTVYTWRKDFLYRSQWMEIPNA